MAAIDIKAWRSGDRWVAASGRHRVTCVDSEALAGAALRVAQMRIRGTELRIVERPVRVDDTNGGCTQVWRVMLSGVQTTGDAP
jgi:hypothetical protein